MTMCMGFLCRNGVVVAADTQQTFVGGHTFHENKVHGLKWKNGRAIWGYAADNADTSKMVWEELERHFTLERTIKRADIKGVVQEALRDVLKSRKREQFLMLFGAWTEGEDKVLLLSSGTDVTYGDRCEVIGFGDTSLSRFFRALYLKTLPNPNVWQTSIAAIYFILQGKKYNGQYVGGGTNILLMEESAANNIRMFAPENSQPWEQVLQNLEVPIVRFLSCITASEEIFRRDEERTLFDSIMEDFSRQVLKLK